MVEASNVKCIKADFAKHEQNYTRGIFDSDVMLYSRLSMKELKN